MRVATPALFAAGLAMLSPSDAKAQYCSSSLLSLPFCVAGAAINTATTIAAAPFRAASGYPYYYGHSYYYRGTGHYRRVRYYSRSQHQTQRDRKTSAGTVRTIKHPATRDLAVS